MKLVYRFKTSAKAKAFVAKVKNLPYVTYANDYMGGGYKAMVQVTELTKEREEELLSIKKNIK